MQFTAFSRLAWNDLRPAVDGRRFLRALALVQGVLAPLIAAVLLAPLSSTTARTALLCVLLAPSVHWFVTFAHRGGGSAQQAALAAPVLLVGQLALVPAGVLLLGGRALMDVLDPRALAVVAGAITGLPLALALALEATARHAPAIGLVLRRAPRFGPPLGVLILFILAAVFGARWLEALPRLAVAALVSAAFTAIAPPLAFAVGRWLGASVVASRTLLFSAGGRNGLVILPFALTFSDPGLAAGVVVTHALVELPALALYAHWLPGLLPDHASSRSNSG